MTDCTVIPAADMQLIRVHRQVAGRLVDTGETRVNLLGSPMGEYAQVWKWDHLVIPRRNASRRVREFVTVMFCREGWHCDSGSPERPSPGGATCSTVLAPGRGDLKEWRAFHAENPVLWKITVKTGRSSRSHRYCDAHLPDEYRPVATTERTAK